MEARLDSIVMTVPRLDPGIDPGIQEPEPRVWMAGSKPGHDGSAAFTFPGKTSRGLRFALLNSSLRLKKPISNRR
jgi:hypothetical protein